MAQSSTELNRFRERTTAFLDAADNIRGVLAPIEGAGETDAQRAAFFAEYIDAQADYDITSAELFAAAGALRNFETWLDDNLATIAKVRI